MDNIFKHTFEVLDDGRKVQEVLERVHTRKIDRKIAQNRMKKKGLSKINRKERSGSGHKIIVEPSYFGRNWRNYAY